MSDSSDNVGRCSGGQNNIGNPSKQKHITKISSSHDRNPIPFFQCKREKSSVSCEMLGYMYLRVLFVAGHKKYRKHIPQYLGKAQAAVIVFDVNKYATYHWAKQWVHEIRELEQEKEMQEQIPILLFGNKTDICPPKWSQMSELREVKQNIARQYAEENQLLYGEGCALADDSFLEGLSSLIKSHFLPNEVILEGKEESKNCCC